MADTDVLSSTEQTPLPTESVQSDQNPPTDETALAVAAGGDNAHTEVAVTADADGQKKTKKIIRRKRRPARPQVDPATIKSEPPPQTGTTFNIWYNKWSGGDREDSMLSKHAAPSRCNVAKDSGYTRADKVPGSYFCLFFARGIWYVIYLYLDLWLSCTMVCTRLERSH